MRFVEGCPVPHVFQNVYVLTTGSEKPVCAEGEMMLCIG
jgi:hypothetical protein